MMMMEASSPPPTSSGDSKILQNSRSCLVITRLLSAAACIQALSFVHAFAPSARFAARTFSSRTQSGQRHGRHSLFSTLNNKGDLDRARASLEELFHQQTGYNPHDPRSQQQPHPHGGAPPQLMHPHQHDPELSFLMTSARRRRRQLEMNLLQSLLDQDGKDANQAVGEESEVINELMHLWMYERDGESAQKLTQMEGGVSSGMFREEQDLHAMMEEYPTWAEPRARLAMLYFFKGQSQECYHFALEALRLKPWHFEVYPLLIMLSLRHGDMGQALHWARRALPPLRRRANPKFPEHGMAHVTRRRRAWIEGALQQASDELARAEQAMADQNAALNNFLEQDHPPPFMGPDHGFEPPFRNCTGGGGMDNSWQ